MIFSGQDTEIPQLIDFNVANDKSDINDFEKCIKEIRDRLTPVFQCQV